MANDHPESIRCERARLLDQRLRPSTGHVPASRRLANHLMHTQRGMSARPWDRMHCINIQDAIAIVPLTYDCRNADDLISRAK